MSEDLGLELRAMQPELRAMQPGDRNFVLSSWLKSYAKSKEFRHVHRSAYFRLYSAVVEAMLDRSTVAVVTLPEAPSAILGWMAVEGDHLHYVYTKANWRTRLALDDKRQPIKLPDGKLKIEARIGIASYLLRDLRDLPVKYTHEPPWWAVMPARWAYDPEARFPKEAA